MTGLPLGDRETLISVRGGSGVRRGLLFGQRTVVLSGSLSTLNVGVPGERAGLGYGEQAPDLDEAVCRSRAWPQGGPEMAPQRALSSPQDALTGA